MPVNKEQVLPGLKVTKDTSSFQNVDLLSHNYGIIVKIVR